MTPEGSTPLCKGLKRFLPSENPQYAPVFTSKGATRYLLLISDGADTCGGGLFDGDCRGLLNPTVPSASQLGKMTARLASEGIRTFVIGFGDGVDGVQLNSIAAAGKTPFKKYLIASDTQSLRDAFEQIAESVVSCVFTLEPEDPTETDLSKINFYFGSDEVPFDQSCAAGGAWRWVDETEKTTVEFCPSACDELQSGEVDQVSATFGCPTIVPV